MPLNRLVLVLGADPQLVEEVAFTVSGPEHDDPAADVGDRFDGGPGFLAVWEQTEFVDDDGVDTLTASWIRGRWEDSRGSSRCENPMRVWLICMTGPRYFIQSGRKRLPYFAFSRSFTASRSVLESMTMARSV